MAITSESVSALASCGVLLFGGYTFWRSRTDKRDEKLEALEKRSTENTECIREIQRDLEWLKKLFKPA